MSDPSNVAKSLRDRFGGNTEERLGRALSDLLENPVLTGALGRAFDAREKAAQAQEVALGALNIPSAADIERLTRRLRSVSHRLEGIEDGVERLEGTLAPGGVEQAEIGRRLSAIETQLGQLIDKLERPQAAPPQPTGAPAAGGSAAPQATSAPAPRGSAASSAARKPAAKAAPKHTKRAKAAKKT